MKFLTRRKLATLFLLWFLANGMASQAQDQGSPVPPDVSLAHYAQIDAGVYVGSKPRTTRDFQFLQSKHIRYIVNARFLPLLSGGERKRAKQYGMTLLTFPMNASLIPPSKKHVNQILFALRDQAHQPVYVHCVLGRDRTSLISGLYKIYFPGGPKDEDLAANEAIGVPHVVDCSRLKDYFDKHSDEIPSGTRR